MFLERRCPGCQCNSRLVCQRCFDLFVPSGCVELEGLDQVVCLFDYDERMSRAILAAKNQGRRDVLRQFGRLLRSRIPVSESIWSAHGAVTWIPASPVNRRERGYDQGRLLAMSVARAGNGPAQRLLGRRGRPQTGQDRRARLGGLDLWTPNPVPETVIVVDDVLTTGASLRSAASILREAGAGRVIGMTIASTGWSASSRKYA